MKIVAGLGSIDDYIPFVEAGADELFCGYVPQEWMLKYGLYTPLNRREVLYYNVQIGSRSELQILRKMIKKYGVPVTIALNALYYIPEQFPMIARIIEECLEEGFPSFIIADPALLVYLKKRGMSERIQIHISGEMSENNHYMIQECRELGAKRIIFHRKVDLSEMESCINGVRKLERVDAGKDIYDRENGDFQQILSDEMEYEAFALNEMCHFHGGFCNSLHCDELTHMCRVPYRLGHYGKKENGLGNKSKDINRRINCQANTVKCSDKIENEREIEKIENESSYITGSSGCGLCALWRMKQAGITHLKLVSRGNYSEDTERDIQQLRKALLVLEEAMSEKGYIDKMKQMIFEGECSGKCYYRK